MFRILEHLFKKIEHENKLNHKNKKMRKNSKEKMKVIKQKILLSLIGIFIIVLLVGGVWGEEVPKTAYYDIKNPLNPWRGEPLGPDWQPVTTEIASQYPKQFDQVFNQDLVGNKERIETLNKRFPNIKFNENSNTFGYRIENDKLVDPKNNNIKHKLNDFEQGTELKPSPENIISKNSGGIFHVGNNIGSLLNSNKNPILSGTCLAKNTPITECISTPEGAPDEKNIGKIVKAFALTTPLLNSFTNQFGDFILPGVSAKQQYPQSQFGGFSGGGSQGGSLGTFDQSFLQALGVVQQLIGLIQQIAAPFMQQSRTNGQGETKASRNDFGGVDYNLEKEAGITFEKNDKVELAASQSDKSQGGLVRTKGNKNEVDLKNIKALKPKQVIIETPTGENTEMVLNGIPDNSDFPVKTDPTKQPSLTGKEIVPRRDYPIVSSLPLIKNSITANVIESKTKITKKAISDFGGQFVKHTGHDIEANGHDITIYALKTFDNVIAGGQELKLFTGHNEIEFNNQRTLFSRLLTNLPYGIEGVKNKLDTNNNELSVQHYTNRLGDVYLTDKDGEKRVTYSDLSSKNPGEPRLIIYADANRLSMWPKN